MSLIRLRHGIIGKGKVVNFPSVPIGTQTWMLYNLDVDTYRDGTPIPQITDNSAWVADTSGAWCYYNNDPTNNAVYGKLYNWYAVNDPRGLAPVGWHVASRNEWIALESYLGANVGAKVAGDYDLWIDGALRNSADFGLSGFKGRPSGYRLGTVVIRMVHFPILVAWRHGGRHLRIRRWQVI